MSVAVAVRYEDDTENPVATRTVVHISATDVDSVNEETDAEIRYYFSAEHATADDARSPVFSGNGEWNGWVAPDDGAWTFHLRKVEDDSSVANSAVTFDAP